MRQLTAQTDTNFMDYQRKLSSTEQDCMYKQRKAENECEKLSDENTRL